jgi:hypothetical protein
MSTTDPDRFVAVAPSWYVSNLGGVIVTGIVARRSGRPSLRMLFAVAVALHVGEAGYAYATARRAGLTGSATRWGLQTLAVGFPSLGALRTVIRNTEPGEVTTT